MAKKIRVYELGRELGLTNKEALDLCISLGIGVKSHSSSIEDQQADRVRRKADREGLRRPVGAVGADGEPAQSQVPSAGQDRGPETLQTDPASLSASASTASGSTPVVEERPAIGASSRSADSARDEPGPTGRPTVPKSDHRTLPDGAGAPTAAGAPVAAASTKSVPLENPETEAGKAAAAGQILPADPDTRTPARSAPPTAGPLAQPVKADGLAGGGAPPARPEATLEPTAGVGIPSSASSAPRRSATPEAVARQGAPERPKGPGDQSAIGIAGHSDPDRRSPAVARRPPQRLDAPPAQRGDQPPDQTRRPTTGAPARPVSARAGGPAPAGAAPAGAAENRPGQEGDVQNKATGPMLSSTGKPIPPPPGVRRPPMSASGKPIPPPPGRQPQSRSGAVGGRPSGPGATRPAMGGGMRSGGLRSGTPGGAPSGGWNRPGGGAPGARPGQPAGGPGGPAGARGGAFGNRGRPQGRRPTRRRRRNIEELEAQEITHYTPSNAPIPDGDVIVERGATAQELGPKLNRSGADVVRFLFQQGEMVTTTQSLSDEMIELFAAEIGASVRLVDPGEEKEAELQAKYFDDEDDDEVGLEPRPPVVTVMGHVDHGKTLLLDRIRTTNVVAGEAGGITQHIGAYQVEYQGHRLTFIDTPGHEAFTAMRARGAEVTDIVILVVAADDGIMPQTVEALNHAKAADVPIVVAINKIDRANADPNRVMQQLSEYGLVPESWGGDTIMVEISALQNFGIDDLLEQVLVVAELEELEANPEGRAKGTVMEANLDPGKGPVATVIVQSGTLRQGDPIVAGAAWGRVKALLDEGGSNIKQAGPSTPVQVLGFGSVPSAGDEFRVTDKAKTARDIGEQREQRFRAADLRRSSSATGTGAKLEDIFEQIQRGETATLNLVLKADTQGSLEAVTESLRKLERDEVKLSFIHRAVGGITENDVTLAQASNATILGFNVRPDRGSRDLAEHHDVEIRTYEIIYKLIEDIESAMVGMLAPEFEEVVTGEAEVREIFRVPRVGAIAGCYVRHGKITRGSKVRFLRDGVIIWKGAITSLKRFKEDAREVSEGFECGVGLSNNQDLREGDLIETFEEREVPRELSRL